MGILSGPEIRNAVKSGQVFIDPFNDAHVGPNSYDLTLADELLVYVSNGKFMDVREDNETVAHRIPNDGMILYPGTLYLGSTVEAAGSDHYVPCIEGRSSMARLGLSPHVSAGFGDHGFKCRWTLELTVTQPIRIYAGIRICQVFFHSLLGEKQPYNGKYANSNGVVASRAHEDYEVRR